MANTNSSPVIIVIGSGLAGLNAARMLVQYLPDFKITILEAQSRPGGRVNSVEIAENDFLEEGATWIHGVDDNPIKDWIKQQTFNDNHYTAEKYCKINGDEVSAESFTIFKRMYHKLRDDAKCLYRNDKSLKSRIHSVGEFLQKEFLQEVKDRKLYVDCAKTASSVFYYMSQLECCISGCSSLFDLLLNDYGEYKELGGGDLRVQGGYAQVVEKLLENLPKNCVIYNSPVTKVYWKGDHANNGLSKPVSVICENGEQYFADHVITTQPLGHLKQYARTMFKPVLPKVKLDIINRMGFNYITKIHLRYETPFWQDTFTSLSLLWDRTPEDVITKPSDFSKETWYKNIFEFAVHPLVSNTLEVWLSGESALYAEGLEEDVISETCTDLLKKFLQDPLIPKPNEVLLTSWNTNPYFRGAYSYVAVGSSGEDCDGLAEPLRVDNTDGVNIPRVLFAGEATHRSFYSTTHGALLSGQREAERLISLYQCSSHK